jgi:hypothetical protein
MPPGRTHIFGSKYEANYHNNHDAQDSNIKRQQSGHKFDLLSSVHEL